MSCPALVTGFGAKKLIMVPATYVSPPNQTAKKPATPNKWVKLVTYAPLIGGSNWQKPWECTCCIETIGIIFAILPICNVLCVSLLSYLIDSANDRVYCNV